MAEEEKKEEQQEERTITDQDKLQRYVPGEQLPELFFFFDTRGEYVGHVSNKCLVVMMDTEHAPNIKRFSSQLGQFKPMGRLNSAIVAPVDEQKTVALFEQEGYYVDKADETDFREIQNELDKLLTIEDDTMKEQNAKRTKENRTDQ